MPAIVPNKDHRCWFGHDLLYRPRPLEGYDNVIIVGCESNQCPQSLNIRYKEFLEEIEEAAN